MATGLGATGSGFPEYQDPEKSLSSGPYTEHEQAFVVADAGGQDTFLLSFDPLNKRYCEVFIESGGSLSTLTQDEFELVGQSVVLDTPAVQNDEVIVRYRTPVEIILADEGSLLLATLKENPIGADQIAGLDSEATSNPYRKFNLSDLPTSDPTQAALDLKTNSADIADDLAKLAGIEAGAQVNDLQAEILAAAIKADPVGTDVIAGLDGETAGNPTARFNLSALPISTDTQVALDTKADDAATQAALATKADAAATQASLDTKADAAATQTALDAKADLVDGRLPTEQLPADVQAEFPADGSARARVVTMPAFGFLNAYKNTLSGDGRLVESSTPFEARVGNAVQSLGAITLPAFGLLGDTSNTLTRSGNLAVSSKGGFTRSATDYSGNVRIDVLFDEAGDVTYYPPEKVLTIFMHMGQSQAFGQNTDTDPLISTTPIYPNEAIMPAAGVHLERGRFTTVAPLVESPYSNARETACSSAANHYIQMHEAATGVRPHVLSMIAAKGGQPISNLGRGSQVFTDFENGLRDAKAYAASIGKVAIMPVVFWNHGQNGPDKYGNSRKAYETAMQQLRKDIVAATRDILGQVAEPEIMIMQADAGENRDIGAANFYVLSTSLAQVELSKLNGFSLSGNEGHFPLSSDNLHYTCEGQYRQGMIQARAAFGQINGNGWDAILAENIFRRSATEYDIAFGAPEGGTVEIVDPGIVAPFDPATKTLFGFQFADDGGTIDEANYSISVIDASAEIQGAQPDRYVRVTFTTAPTGTLYYSLAMRSDANGAGRSYLASAATYTPLQTLPTPDLDRDYAIASFGRMN